MTAPRRRPGSTRISIVGGFPFVPLVVLTLLSLASTTRAGPSPAAQAENDGRRPVLGQVEVPHPYYWREMYVPQVTTGPRSPAWSPDGAELVYSMEGSLWRQEPGSPVATQLTDGPGYHHQPDWSPDGRWIVYSAYDGEAIELRVLEVGGASGAAAGEAGSGGGSSQGSSQAPSRTASRILLSNGAVNLEPRFSPDGGRIAFVSTFDFGRWHVFVASFENGRLGTPRRVTDDRDSGLPRYYYSVHDHWLSPTWSPDGDELIVVSNRGRIWGSGGLWRLPLDSDAGPREIRYEETTWRARPDWSPDGNRVVYASYLGRQHHQLWLMTDEGGDSFPITYEAFGHAAFDATEPRWSPDGRRIAYVSNQEGWNSLRVVDVPGGERRRVEIGESRTLRPTGRLRVEVVDGAERPLPARVSVTGEDGRGWAPAGVLRHSDVAFDRAERAFEPSWFYTAGAGRPGAGQPGAGEAGAGQGRASRAGAGEAGAGAVGAREAGAAELDLPAGSYTVEAYRGPEYVPERSEVTVEPGSTRRVVVELERIADPGADGWFSGDLHVHMNYSGAYAVRPEELVRQAAGEGLDVVENLVVNKEQRFPDIEAFRTDRDPASTRGSLLFHGEEFHTSLWGHTALLGLDSHLILPGYAAYVNTAAASFYPQNTAVFEMARDQGAVTGYVHPFESVPDPSDRSAPLTHELPVSAALGGLDYLEVVGFSDHLATSEVWYRLLDCGFRIPAGAGTDAVPDFATVLGGPVGLDRVYVRVEGELDHASFLEGIRSGRTFATNGPLLELSMAVAGMESPASIGDEIELGPGRHELRVTGSLRSPVPVDHLEIIRNGEVVAGLPLSEDGRSADVDHVLEADGSGWYVLRAWSEGARHPVLDPYPFATTSPIWVTVDGGPVRSEEDAAYFVAWIDRLVETASESDAYNTADEREAVMGALARAREVFVDRGGPSSGPGQGGGSR